MRCLLCTGDDNRVRIAALLIVASDTAMQTLQATLGRLVLVRIVRPS
jgi:hypothetical protein